MQDWVLADTLIWASFFSKPESPEKRAVDDLIDADRVALIGPILAEVLLGFRRNAQADLVASRLRAAHFWRQLGSTGSWQPKSVESSQRRVSRFPLPT